MSIWNILIALGMLGTFVILSLVIIAIERRDYHARKKTED